MISIHIRGKPFNITVIQVYAPTTNAEETEVERFSEDLQDLLELTSKIDVLFIIVDWNAKVGSQEIHGIRAKRGLGVQNEAGKRLTEFCQDTTLVIANTSFQKQKRWPYTWTSPKINIKIKWFIFFAAKDGDQKQDWDLNVAQIDHELITKSDLNWRK